jgi:hypothetical protein
VQVNSHQPVHTGGLKEVGHHLGADRRARADLSVLARITVVGHNGRNPAGAGAFERVKHEAELDQIEIDGSAGGLDNEHVIAAHIVSDFDADLPVAEGFTHRGSKPATEMIGYGRRKLGV